MCDGFSYRPLRVDGAGKWREGGALSNLMQMRLRLESRSTKLLSLMNRLWFC
jgi:hypothetical protein